LGETKYVVVKLDNLVIELLEPEKKESVKVGLERTVNHFAIQVENLENVIADLEQKGVKFTTDLFEMKDLFGGIKGTFLKGSTGEKIELFEYAGNKPF